MRVGLLIYGSLEITSGGYLYDRKLVQHLRDQGDDVEIFSLPWRNYLRHLGDNFSIGLQKRLQGVRLDLLLQDELNHPSLFLLNNRLRRNSAYPLISIVHHLRSSEKRLHWFNQFYRLLESRYLSSVHGYIFNSKTTRRAVVQSGVDMRYKHCVMAYPAGDRFQAEITGEDIRGRAKQPGPLRLLFLGNLIPRKGLHLLLEALSRLPEGSWSLNVVGEMKEDKAYSRSILRKVEANGWGQKITLCGQLDEVELANVLRASQVMVVPSSYEGFGIVYLEGMSFGLPAIATTRGAAGEIITHGRDGFLVQPNDPGDLAARLSMLIHNRDRLAAMSLAARERFESHPTWEQTGNRIREYLLRVAEQPPFTQAQDMP